MRRSTVRLTIALSALASAIAIFLIGAAWSEAEHELPDNVEKIEHQAALERFVADEAEAQLAQNFRGTPPVQVPTGVFVQSVAFVSSSDVNVTGYIWQKYPKDFPYEKGFDLPEEVMSEDTVIEEAYRERIDHNGTPFDLIGYYFDVTVRQSFDYSRYPLDYLTIWLRIWPENLQEHANVLFVPDFDSYSKTAGDVFGLDGDLVQGEWTIESTFYSYARIPYDTNFGFNAVSQDATYNEFFFNLSAERKFINAFIISLVPLLVISLLLFSTLMTISCDRDRAERFGFNTTAVLGTCSGLFFLVLLSHIQVRSLFPGSGLVYIEYFYLVLYGMILLVALNGYLFSIHRSEHASFLHWGDNFIARAGFWPLLLWALALISWQTL